MATIFRETDMSVSDEPMFVISVAARLVEMHPQTLRYYERAGLVKPKRSRGSIRLYSERDIERLKKIARLIDDLGVNLAGVEVIIHLTEKLELMQNLLEQNQIPVPDANAENVEPVAGMRTNSKELQAADKVKIQVRRPRNTAKTQTAQRALTKSNKE
jgi:MerR family transcriptional regulator/heat shock protein HspR